MSSLHAGGVVAGKTSDVLKKGVCEKSRREYRAAFPQTFCSVTCRILPPQRSWLRPCSNPSGKRVGMPGVVAAAVVALPLAAQFFSV
jgi:hypothetical protein